MQQPEGRADVPGPAAEVAEEPVITQVGRREVVRFRDLLVVRAPVREVVAAVIVFCVLVSIGVGFAYAVLRLQGSDAPADRPPAAHGARRGTGRHVEMDPPAAANASDDRAASIAFAVLLGGAFGLAPVALLVSSVRGRFVPWVFDRSAGTMARGRRVWPLDAVEDVCAADLRWSWVPGARVIVRWRDRSARPVTIVSAGRQTHRPEPEIRREMADLADEIGRFVGASARPAGEQS